MKYFKDLYFGAAEAANDVTSDRDRFLRTYYDRWDLPNLILKQEKSLILGPKGSGKSAAAHYVANTWKKTIGDHAVFENIVDFDELNRTQSPLTRLDSSLVSDEINAPTDAAWRLFVGVRLLDSLIREPHSSVHADPQILSFMESLRRAGLAADDFPQVLRRVRERKGSVSVPKFASLEGKWAESETLSPGQVADAVIEIVVNAKSNCRHLLAIDGLDKAISDRPSYWQTVAALIRVVDSIRRKLQAGGNAHVFVLVMCRSDVFRRVRFSDSAKIAADGGVNMDWGAEFENPLDVILWDYIARKAEVSKATLLGLLPRKVTVASGNKDIEISKYLLQFTRYTPRDMTLLFRQLRDEAGSLRTIDGRQVRRAADRFASENLLIEIISEASGLLDNKVIDAIEQVLGGLPGNYFTSDELALELESNGLSDVTTRNALAEYLFLQGAIGNYNPSARYVQFYHRRHTSKFNRKGPWVLQTGLVYALNIPFRKGYNG
jgi:hypothetical protein